MPQSDKTSTKSYCGIVLMEASQGPVDGCTTRCRPTARTTQCCVGPGGVQENMPVTTRTSTRVNYVTNSDIGVVR